jgi:hypothetical protein
VRGEVELHTHSIHEVDTESQTMLARSVTKIFDIDYKSVTDVARASAPGGQPQLTRLGAGRAFLLRKNGRCLGGRAVDGCCPGMELGTFRYKDYKLLEPACMLTMAVTT